MRSTKRDLSRIGTIVGDDLVAALAAATAFALDSAFDTNAATTLSDVLVSFAVMKYGSRGDAFDSKRTADSKS